MKAGDHPEQVVLAPHPATVPVSRRAAAPAAAGVYLWTVGFAAGSGSTCPHGLAAWSCEICRVLDGGPAAVPARRRRPRAARTDAGAGRRLAGLSGMGVSVVVALVVVVVVVQTFALVSVFLRLAQLLGVAVVAGYVGWRLGRISSR